MVRIAHSTKAAKKTHYYAEREKLKIAGGRVVGHVCEENLLGKVAGKGKWIVLV